MARADVGGQLRVTVGRHVDQATRTLIQAYARAWQQVRDELLTAVTDAERQALERGAEHSPAAYRTQRLQRSLTEIGDQLEALTYIPGVTVERHAGEVVRAAPEVMAHLGRLAGVRFDAPPRDALASIVARATDRIASNRPQLSAIAEAELRSTLTVAMAAGEGPREAARKLVAQTRAAEAARLGLPTSRLAELRQLQVAPAIIGQVRGAFAGGLARGLNLQRTELIDASRRATTACYLANPHLVTGWRWVASLSPRTCPACWAMHGTVHQPEEHQLGHQSCRCTQVPVLADDQPGDSDVGDAMAAFRRLSRDQQLAVMGPARLEALDGGRPLSDLVHLRDNAGWRPGYYAKPVRDLIVTRPGQVGPTRLAAGAPGHPPAPFLAGTDPRTLTDEALAHLLDNPRVWEDDARPFQLLQLELDRRDAITAARAELEAASAAEQAAIVDSLDAWETEKATADQALRDAGLDPADYQVARRSTRTEAELMRHDFEVWVESQYLQASEELNGALLRRDAPAGMTETDLWTGAHHIAWRYATEELQAWWQEHPRMTWTEWQAAHGVGGERMAERARKAAETRGKGSQVGHADRRRRDRGGR